MRVDVLAAVAIGSTLFAACSSTGASAPAFTHGTTSFGAAVAISNTKLDDSFDELEIDTSRLEGSWGYFLTPNIEVGAGLGYESTQQSINGIPSTEGDLLSVGASTRFFLNSESQVRPYLGAGLGLLKGSAGDTDIDGNYFSLSLGLVSFLSESAALDTRIAKAWSSEEWQSDFDTGDVDRDQMAFLVGMSFYY